MKKIATWLIAIPLLSSLIFISSCKKGDDGPDLASIENITFTQLGNSTVISWVALQGAESYMVSINDIAVSDYPIISNSVSVTSLVDGAEIKIDAYNDPLMNNIIASTTMEYEDQSASTVNNIVFNDMGDDVLVLWDAVQGAKSYMVSIAGIPDSEYPITNTSHNAGSLMDGIDVKVEAFSDVIATQLIASGTANYSSQQVGILTNLKLTDQNGSVTVSWNLYQGANYYMIYKNNQMVLSNAITYNQYVAGSLSNGSIIRVDAFYDMSMQTLVASSETVYSATQNAPDPVNNLYVDAYNSNSISLTWNNPLCEYTKIEIYNGERTSGNTSNLLKNIPAGNEYVTISDLTSNHTYEFYVYIVNENNPVDVQYSNGESITQATGSEELNLDGTVWYKPDGVGYADYMTLTFHENTVDWQDGDDYFYEGLSYSYDPVTRTGVIDEGGFYDGDFSIDQGEVFLTFMGDLVFYRTQK